MNANDFSGCENSPAFFTNRRRLIESEGEGVMTFGERRLLD